MQVKRKRLAGPRLSGLLATRGGALTFALGCALAATAVLVFALGKYRQAVSTGAKQDTVLVATSEIRKGTPAGEIASKHLYKITPVLTKQVLPGAIVNAATLNGQMAASEILPGQQLTATEFTSMTSAGSVAAELSPTERAVAVTLDPAHGTSALQVGDHVDVYGSLATPSGTVVALVVPNAVVLRLPSSSGGGGSTVLLGTGMKLSPKVMWVFDNGKLWLELRGLNSTNPSPAVTGLAQVLAGDQVAARVNGLSGTLTYTAPSTAAATR